MEKAQQTGDADTWIGLWSRESSADAEKMRPQIRPRPDLHYTSSRAFVQGEQAVLLGQFGKEQFLSMRFVREDGRWKIKDQVFNNKAFTAESVYAMIPPPAGASGAWGNAVAERRAGVLDKTWMRPDRAGSCGQLTMSRS